jgi:hypothetical protein
MHVHYKLTKKKRQHKQHQHQPNQEHQHHQQQQQHEQHQHHQKHQHPNTDTYSHTPHFDCHLKKEGETLTHIPVHEENYCPLDLYSGTRTHIYTHTHKNSLTVFLPM